MYQYPNANIIDYYNYTNNNYNKLKHEIDLLIGQENDSL